MEQNRFRVLSIQSHVVCGYVGNKSATFPLQVLGFEVDAINSVQFSNHTGYEHVKGQVLESSDLGELFLGLTMNDIHHYSHLLTGYCCSESFLNDILIVVKELRKKNPALVFVCDPVLGDNGKFYVPESLLQIYRDKIIPLADVITPNQFEAELLSGIKIRNEEDAIKATDILHSKGTKTVIISSTEIGVEGTLTLLASSKTESGLKRVRLRMPKMEAIFTGTGDLFSCMLLAWMAKYPGDLKTACEKTISAIHLVLKRTQKAMTELAGPGNKPTAFQRELRIIDSLDDIRNPPDLFKADEIH
ncbi:pyridoxal kinase-like [Rhopilema esculentum]|uniref:pyridoxal kinase-like n=1 Tax=Rhopilema esculentum TaxID=499914 RepID=UPI0031DF1F32|eukprot:gene17491-9106_t